MSLLRGLARDRRLNNNTIVVKSNALLHRPQSFDPFPAFLGLRCMGWKFLECQLSLRSFLHKEKKSKTFYNVNEIGLIVLFSSVACNTQIKLTEQIKLYVFRETIENFEILLSF